jgi:hypothetical protein
MTKFSKDLFEPLVDKVFILHKGDGGIVELRLKNIKSREIARWFESFTLNFDPPKGEPHLPDNTYMMEAEGFGPELVSISAKHAGTPDPTAYYYEAVFNVLKEEYKDQF